LLKNWNGGTVKSLEIPEPKKRRGFDIYLIDKPGAAQSELRFGHTGVSRQTEDYYPIEVVNTILGGSFTSRLNQNIREEHGYAYGARSYFFQPRQTGFFLAYAAVQTDVTDKAIQEFMKELNGIHSIPEADLEKARNYAALSFPGEFQSVQQIAGNLSDIVFYDLPQDWLNRHMERLLNVDRTAAERAARTYVTTDSMVLVVVGDKTKIADKIEALKLGEIHYLSKEEVLGAVPN